MRHWLITLGTLLVGIAGCNRSIADGRADGAAIYAEACARCHGRAGAPPPDMKAQLGVPDLTEPALHERLSDKAMGEQIYFGKPDKGMPSFQGALGQAQIDAVVAHVRTLAAR